MGSGFKTVDILLLLAIILGITLVLDYFSPDFNLYPQSVSAASPIMTYDQALSQAIPVFKVPITASIGVTELGFIFHTQELTSFGNGQYIIDPDNYIKLNIEPEPATCSYTVNQQMTVNLPGFGTIFSSSRFDTPLGIDKLVHFDFFKRTTQTNEERFLERKSVEATSFGAGAEIEAGNEEEGFITVQSNGINIGNHLCPQMDETDQLIIREGSYYYVVDAETFNDLRNDYNHLQCQSCRNNIPIICSQLARFLCDISESQYTDYFVHPSRHELGAWSILRNKVIQGGVLKGDLSGDASGNFLVTADARAFGGVFELRQVLANPKILSCETPQVTANGDAAFAVTIENQGDGITPITVSASSPNAGIDPPSRVITLQPDERTNVAFTVDTGAISEGSYAYTITATSVDPATGSRNDDAKACIFQVVGGTIEPSDRCEYNSQLFEDNTCIDSTKRCNNGVIVEDNTCSQAQDQCPNIVGIQEDISQCGGIPNLEILLGIGVLIAVLIAAIFGRKKK